MLQASLQRDPGVEGSGQIRPTYANGGLVQCFRLSSIVDHGNVLISRYLWPKSIADTLSITLFTSIGDNSIDILKNIGDKVSTILDILILTSLVLTCLYPYLFPLEIVVAMPLLAELVRCG